MNRREGLEIFIIVGGIIAYRILPMIIPNIPFLKYFGIFASIITSFIAYLEKRQNFLGNIKNIRKLLSNYLKMDIVMNLF
jgi:hypothetical protein